MKPVSILLSADGATIYPGSRKAIGAIAIALIVMFCGGVFAATARASWEEGKCSAADNNHCYAIAEWNLKNPPEEAKGGVAYMTTDSIDAPGWASGDFVDNEMWVSFPGGNWLESGQTAGNGYDCCTIHAFWAYQRDGTYEEWLAPTAGNPPTNHYIIEDTSPGSSRNWCIYWGEYVTQACFSEMFPAYASDLEAGIEAATNEKPENEGSDEVAVVLKSGEWHSWSGPETESKFTKINYKREPVSKLCIKLNPSSPYPGNGVFETC